MASSINTSVTASRLSNVLTTLVWLHFLCITNVCQGNSAPGGGSNISPLMYGSHQQHQQQQQQWSGHHQQQQPQYHDYAQYQHPQQQVQLQQQQQLDQPAPVTSNNAAAVAEEIPPLPPGWSEHIDPSSGQTYYYNSNDGTTTWDRPQPPPPPPAAASGSNGTSTHIDDVSGYDTIIKNEQQSQEQSLDIPSSLTQNPVYSNEMESSHVSGSIEDSQSTENAGSTSKEPHDEISLDNNSAPSSNDNNVLTSIRRDEKNIVEEKQWRDSQGWNTPSSDNFESGRVDEGSISTPTNVEMDISKDSHQEHHSQQGWGLPGSPQQQNIGGWGANKAALEYGLEDPSGTKEKPTSAQQLDQYPKVSTLLPNQSQQPYEGQNINENTAPDGGLQQSGDGKMMNDNYPISQKDNMKPIQNDPPHMMPPSQRQGPYQQQGPTQYQRPPPQQQYQQTPTKEHTRPPNTGGPSQDIRVPPQQFTQQQQQLRPAFAGQPPYAQHQQSSGGGSNSFYNQQQYPYGAGRSGQIPPQYGRQPPPYPNQQQYPLIPGQSSVQQQPQSGGQLITQEQQNLVKESIGRTWQSILGLKDKTKEVIETTTSTVAQSAREATQTIAEKGTGWWGQATKVLGSVFEAEAPSSEYSLSGIYGNVPPIQGQQQEPPRGYPPPNPNYPQYRVPPNQQQYPPQGPGQQQQRPPQQIQYPPGYGPPQPRVDVPYPNQQQGPPRQSMPPIQRQLGGNIPQQQGYPPQIRQYDQNRQGYPQNVPSQQQQIQAQQTQQQQQGKREDAHSAWSHPGLGSEY